MPNPVPTNLKILRGNPGKRPLTKNEPIPEAEKPPIPSHLGEIAKKEWDRVVPALYELGLLTKIDRSALAAYCSTYERWVEAERGLQKHGTIIKNAVGQPTASPFVKIAEVALAQMLRFMSEFGMTPSSRTRISVNPATKPEPKDKKSKANKYF